MPRPVHLLTLLALLTLLVPGSAAVAQDDPPNYDTPPGGEITPPPPPTPGMEADRGDERPSRRDRGMRPRRSDGPDFDRPGSDRPPRRPAPDRDFRRPGSDGPGRGEPRKPRKPLTDEQTEELFGILQQINPRFAEGLAKVRKIRPERFRQGLQRIAPRLEHLVQLKDDDPELFQLEIENRQLKFKSFRLSQAIRKARTENTDPAKIEAMQNQLRDMLDKHFDVRQKILERELKHMAKRIEKLKGQLRQRQENRKQLIDQYMRKLMTAERMNDRERDPDRKRERNPDRKPDFDRRRDREDDRRRDPKP